MAGGVWARLRESPLAMLGLLLVVFWLVLALLAPVLPFVGPECRVGCVQGTLEYK